MQDKAVSEISLDQGWSVDGLPAYEAEILYAETLGDGDPIGAVRDVEFMLGLERDPRVAAALQIRVNATINRPCYVVPGGDRDQDLYAADFVKEVLLSSDELSQSGIIDGYSSAALSHGLLAGYGVAELMIAQSDGFTVIEDIRSRLPSRFTFWKSNGNPKNHHHFGYELRMLTTTDPFKGSPLPAGKMACFSFGSRTNHPRGFGLGARLYWSVILKRKGMRSWLRFCDKFAQPTIIAELESDLQKTGYGADDIKEIEVELDRFLARIQSGMYARLPANAKVHLLEAQRGGSEAIYEQLNQWFNSEIAEVILGNVNYGTAQGLSGAPAQNDENVRLEIAKSDADLFHDQTINRQIVRTLIDLNRDKLGDAGYPRIWRDFREEEDRTELLNRWKILFDMGWSPSEDLIRSTFGDGWERSPAPPKMPPTSPQFAEPKDTQPTDDLIEESELGYERLLNRAVEDGSKKFKALLNPVFALVNRAQSIAEIRQGFPTLKDAAKLGALQKLLAQAMLSVRLASEYEAMRVTEPEAIAFDEPIDPYNLPFSEAIDWFANKVSVSADDLAKLRGQYRNEAFYISGLTNAALLDEMRNLTERILTEGISLEEFKAEFKRLADESGWMPKGGTSSRAESVFDANLRSAFAAGQFIQYTKPHILESYPEWEWRHRTPDPARARPHHLAQNGRIFPASADPPFFLPSGFRCFPGDTLIATPGGWTRIDRLGAGDIVIGGSGKPQLVNLVHINPFNGHLLRVVTPDGSSFAATPNHRVLTMRGWVKLENLRAKDHLVQLRKVPPINIGIRDVNQSRSGQANLSMSSPAADLGIPWIKRLDPQIKVGKPNVHPTQPDRVIVDHGKSATTQPVDQDLFAAGWRRAVIDMARATSMIFCQLVSDCKLTNFGAVKRGGLPQLFRFLSLAFIQIFRSTPPEIARLSPVPIQPRHVWLSIRTPNPLNGYRLGIGSSQAELRQQCANRVTSHLPASGQLTSGHQLIDVEDSEGFTSGHPLSLFDSLECFQSWATNHATLTPVLKITKEPFSGLVYNLDVPEDESYCIPQVVAHNCRCRMIPRERSGRPFAEIEMRDRTHNGITEKAPFDPVTREYLTDPGWGKPPTPQNREALLKQLGQ